MSEIKEIRDVVACRELVFISSDGKMENVLVKIGMPYEYNEQKDWCCPYELVSESHRRLYGMIGIDSLQALELTMKTIKTEIEFWEKSKDGKFHFLDEEGSGI